METDFYFEEVLAGVWDGETITPSTGGITGDFDDVGSDDGCGALGNNSYKVLDQE